MFGYVAGSDEAADLVMDPRDSALGLLKSVVVDNRFDWGGDRQLATPLARSVIYEAHVRGGSQLCPHLPEEQRGTYAAMGSE